MRSMADVTAVWRRHGSHYDRVSPVRWDRMHSNGERKWFADKAQELVDTEAAVYGPDLIATLPDDTTYSVPATTAASSAPPSRYRSSSRAPGCPARTSAPRCARSTSCR